ncbi:hypothetical protein QAD02_012961 [Eretmocerus hayati]|uniref:Uncharacterized protein n=1 Tax=Eretmocerus hayati TaxID=131215 RepID=A0ACC2P1H0_9HYME|nr:hypothetical protein QAD02_012961 [Eretmocerus hayati]
MKQVASVRHHTSMSSLPFSLNECVLLTGKMAEPHTAYEVDIAGVLLSFLNDCSDENDADEDSESHEGEPEAKRPHLLPELDPGGLLDEVFESLCPTAKEV